jgi:hypothetical protein
LRGSMCKWCTFFPFQIVNRADNTRNQCGDSTKVVLLRDQLSIDYCNKTIFTMVLRVQDTLNTR